MTWFTILVDTFTILLSEIAENARVRWTEVNHDRNSNQFRSANATSSFSLSNSADLAWIIHELETQKLLRPRSLAIKFLYFRDSEEWQELAKQINISLQVYCYSGRVQDGGLRWTWSVYDAQFAVIGIALRHVLSFCIQIFLSTAHKRDSQLRFQQKVHKGSSGRQ